MLLNIDLKKMMLTKNLNNNIIYDNKGDAKKLTTIASFFASPLGFKEIIILQIFTLSYLYLR